MNIVIKTAAIRSSLFLTYEFEQKDIDVNNTIKTSSDAPIHDDLRNAFKALIPHFAFICEEITNESLVSKAIQDPEMYLSDSESAPDDSFFKFNVNSFSMVDLKKGLNFVSISGSKQLSTLEVISFTSPSIDLEGGTYKFRAELAEAIEVLKKEVLAYMQGKQAAKTQMEMFGEDSEENEPADNTVSMHVVKSPKAKKEKAQSAFEQE